MKSEEDLEELMQTLIAQYRQFLTYTLPAESCDTNQVYF
jgi:hypothetical protein